MRKSEREFIWVIRFMKIMSLDNITMDVMAISELCLILAYLK